jgi:hypothetical protein
MTVARVEYFSQNSLTKSNQLSLLRAGGSFLTSSSCFCGGGTGALFASAKLGKTNDVKEKRAIIPKKNKYTFMFHNFNLCKGKKIYSII